MSATFYDEALLKKIKNWVRDPNIRITSPDETRRLFSYRLDQNNDEPIKLPLIALSRSNTMRIKNTSKNPLTYDGFKRSGTLMRTDEGSIEGKIEQINAIPVGLDYTIDIYTRYYEEAEEYVRNFIFNLINYPKMQIQIPYNSYNEKKYCSITLNADVQDNSDIPERLAPGQFTRKTISLSIEDAYLWDVRNRDTFRINEEPCCIDVRIDSDINVKLEENKN